MILSLEEWWLESLVYMCMDDGHETDLCIREQ